jgi:hypothetical protein
MKRHKNHRALYIILLSLLFIGCSVFSDGWFDDGSMYVCPECAQHPYLQLGDICERCGGGTTVNPLIYCYSCARELNCCQCCGEER